MMLCSLACNSETVPLFNSREIPSVPPSDSVRVIALETTFIPAGHEAVVLGTPITQRFLFVSLERQYQLASSTQLKL